MPVYKSKVTEIPGYPIIISGIIGTLVENWMGVWLAHVILRKKCVKKCLNTYYIITPVIHKFYYKQCPTSLEFLANVPFSD